MITPYTAPPQVNPVGGDGQILKLSSVLVLNLFNLNSRSIEVCGSNFEYCWRKYILILHVEHEISNPCSKPQGILCGDIPSNYLGYLRYT